MRPTSATNMRISEQGDIDTRVKCITAQCAVYNKQTSVACCAVELSRTHHTHIIRTAQMSGHCINTANFLHFDTVYTCSGTAMGTCEWHRSSTRTVHATIHDVRLGDANPRHKVQAATLTTCSYLSLNICSERGLQMVLQRSLRADG